MPHNLDEVDDAAIFMSENCPEDLKKYRFYDLDYPLPQAFAALLTQNSALHQKLEATGGGEDLTQFWVSCRRGIESLSTFRRMSNRGKQLGLPADIPSGIPKFLHLIRPRLTSLVKGELSFPSWRPKVAPTDDPDILHHIESLKLISVNGSPEMELQDLGSFKDDPVLNARLNDIFNTEQDTFLVNTSGSGKTRLLYEGLCQNWGFYFTSALDVKASLASGDVDASIVEDLCVRTAFTEVLPPVNSLAFKPLLEANINFANRLYSEILLARLLVFKLFIEIIHDLGDGLTKDHKCRWLTVQLYPRLVLDLNIGDVFSGLASYLRHAPLPYIEETLSRTLEETRVLYDNLADTPLHLFIALDEANVSSMMHIPAFWDDQGNYPVLKAILRTWRERMAGMPVSFVTAGTEIPRKFFTQEEWKSFVWSSNTGAFDDPELQRKYATRFFPKSLTESSVGQELIREMWEWLRGRHRWTARLIMVLLQHGFENPQALLRLLVNWLTYFTLPEIDIKTKSLSAAEDKSGPLRELQSLFDKGTRHNQSLPGIIHEVLFHCLITAAHPVHFDAKHIYLVSYGVGRFEDTSMQQIVIDEPLILRTASATWYQTRPVSLTTYPEFVKLFKHESPRPYNAAGYICTYLSYALNGSRPVDQVFKFRGKAPKWAALPAQLVRLHRVPDTSTSGTIVSSSEVKGSEWPLGYSAHTNDDVVSWLKLTHRTAFCICPPSCSADLIFTLKLSTNQHVWVVLRASGNGSSNDVSQSRLQGSFDSLLPQNLFGFQDESVYSPTRSKVRPDPVIASALRDLPEREHSLGEYPMLRVVASFPNTPSFDDFAKRSSTDSPTAALDTSLFEELTDDTEFFVPSDLVEGMMASFLGKRQIPWPEDISDTESTKRHRMEDPAPPKPASATKDSEIASKTPDDAGTNRESPSPKPTSATKEPRQTRGRPASAGGRDSSLSKPKPTGEESKPKSKTPDTANSRRDSSLSKPTSATREAMRTGDKPARAKSSRAPSPPTSIPLAKKAKSTAKTPGSASSSRASSPSKPTSAAKESKRTRGKPASASSSRK